jgi:hypothetical protein
MMYLLFKLNHQRLIFGAGDNVTDETTVCIRELLNQCVPDRSLHRKKHHSSASES